MSALNQRKHAATASAANSGGSTVPAGGTMRMSATKKSPTMNAALPSSPHDSTNSDDDADDSRITERTELTHESGIAMTSTTYRVDSTSSPASADDSSILTKTPSHHTLLHTPMNESVELTHTYQDQQVTHAKQMKKKDEATTVVTGPTVRQELPKMILLVALYTLQGVPLGLCLGSIPFLLQQSVSYTALGFFTFASWPYSLKLLWSPLVDCWYSQKIGRRKSWIVPAQFAIGLMMIGMSYYIEAWIAAGEVRTLTITCFLLITLVATQDIAVDGWAISLLSKANVGYASTCQSIGQNIGFFASYTIFLALNHAEFCNKFRSVPSTEGFVTLNGYLYFWGISFLFCTLYLLVFQRESSNIEEGEDMSLKSIYKKMWRIMKLKPVRDLLLLMLTCRVAFAAGDNLTVLKLIEYGFPKENMAFLVVILFPFELVTPVLVGKWMSTGNPLKPWIIGYPFRLFVTLLGVGLVATFPSSSTAGALPDLSYSFYARILFVHLVYSLASNILFVSQCGFFAQICDESIGGTYMTLLNTICNLGSAWPKFFVFAAVDLFTCKVMKGDTGVNGDGTAVAGATNTTDSSSTSSSPVIDSSPCYGWIPRGIDGYYIISSVCFLIGCLWYALLRKRVLQLGATEKKYWSCS